MGSSITSVHYFPLKVIHSDGLKQLQFLFNTEGKKSNKPRILISQWSNQGEEVATP